MKKIRTMLRGLVLMLIVMIMLPGGLGAQDSGEPVPDDKFSSEELAQMLAPIALYPDSLLAQILMAATYPLEVVEAERWIRQNKDLRGDALDNALQEKTWDPSVKSLCHYPDVLFAMSDRLDQTRTMGDAYLTQQDDVMTTVQELRRRAEEQGNLKTTKEQKVIVEQEVIRIEPADPDVVYLPVYNPVYVYGPWWYPAYPPWYWYYPPGIVVSGGFITFGSPFFIGFDLFSWSWFDWHHHHIFVDFNRTRHFHRRHDRDFGKHQWQHDPVHRHGVAYRDRRTSERFGQQPAQRRRPDSQVRGYPSLGDRQRTITPGTTTDRQRSRERIEQRGTTAQPSMRTKGQRVQGAPRTETPFRGVGEGSFERRAGKRGGQSLRSQEMRRPTANIQQRQGGGGGVQQQRGGSRGNVSQQGGGARGSGQSGGARSGGQGGGARR